MTNGHTESLVEKAKRLYSEYSGNHPTIHCNRFPSWDELSQAERDKWYAKVAQ